MCPRQRQASLKTFFSPFNLIGSIDKPGTSLPTWAIILLAVSFSLLFILILVLIIIFCCCCVSGRENKESSYQSQVRKSASVKTNDETFETKSKSGNENYGYISDVATLRPRSSEASALGQHSSRQPHQSPDDHRPGPTSRLQVSFNVASPRKVRNVTLV
ncbi:hypothetical protein MC885_012716 [Smutsia gigantea]|nr:hypothetical protein MC885_012716 [Smutsia gigantea]